MFSPEVKWIASEAAWLVGPGLADSLIGCKAAKRFEPVGEVVCIQESREVRPPCAAIITNPLAAQTATTIASAERTVERGVFGPIRASWMELRLHHLATVFWLRPYCAARPLSGAFDHCIAVRMVCVVVALP